MASAYKTSAALYDFFASNPVHPTVASGEILKLQNLQSGIYPLSAGTYKIDPAGRLGHRFFLRITGTVVLQTVGGTHVATIKVDYGRSSRVVEVLFLSETEAVVSSGISKDGFIDLPFTRWREVTTNDIGAAAAAGGTLATDTTPAYEYINGDTNSGHRLLWAASNQDPITTQFTLPYDFDATQPLIIHMTGLMAGTSNTPVMDCDAFFGEQDTKIEDASAAFSDTLEERIITIAAADYAASTSGSPQTVSIELTPGAHGTDALTLYQIWATYTKKF